MTEGGRHCLNVKMILSMAAVGVHSLARKDEVRKRRISFHRFDELRRRGVRRICHRDDITAMGGGKPTQVQIKVGIAVNVASGRWTASTSTDTARLQLAFVVDRMAFSTSTLLADDDQ